MHDAASESAAYRSDKSSTTADIADIVGDKDAVKLAIRNVKNNTRLSDLVEKLAKIS